MSLIPLQVRFGSEEFSDGVNLSHRQFFEKLIESAELPQTSQINEFRWGELFEKKPKTKIKLSRLLYLPNFRVRIPALKSR